MLQPPKNMLGRDAKESLSQAAEKITTAASTMMETLVSLRDAGAITAEQSDSVCCIMSKEVYNNN